MIKKIVMNKVASYKKSTELVTEKRINLIYGLNGTGKSTLSKYLYNMNDISFKNCSIESTGDNDFLVYNQEFVQDNFYEDSLQGIFTLSKENKSAQEKIDNLTAEINRLDDKKNELLENNKTIESNLEKLDTDYQNIIWNVKRDYENIEYLKYCFTDFKKDKRHFFDYLLSIDGNYPEELTISDVVNRIKELSDKSDSIPNVSEIKKDVIYIENDTIFEHAIIGSENSSLSKIIEKLNSSDWVKKGIDYLDLDSDKTEKCPFCQEQTVDNNFKNELKNLFDINYEKDVTKIESYYKIYSDFQINLPELNINQITLDESLKNKIIEQYDNYKKIVNENLKKIKEKNDMPSIIVKLNDTSSIINEINELIRELNIKINNFNEMIKTKDDNLKQLKKEFWLLIKKNNETSFTQYLEQKAFYQSELKSNDEARAEIINQININENLIVDERKNTINIEDAIDNINNMLIEIGVTDFRVTKASNEMYKIVRNDNDPNIFNTLSEGEKMIISFLYFIEMCKGINQQNSVNKNKIIVIDDPINSMSHIYVFNVGRLIKKSFYDNNKYKQIFIMTHSLYFFYELVYMNEEKRHEHQQLFRISKNNDTSIIDIMHYEEIQNDYQAYWKIIKDKNSSPALIANCMRNIIEYFFGFVEDIPLSNVFQKQELQANRFQAFNRYINRESHSIGQNIFDIKEFNYDDFLEGFKLVFKLTNYEKHYKKMME